MGNDARVASTETEAIARKEAELQLLLEEYRTLRTELLQRISSRLQLLGFFGASAALVVGVRGERAAAYFLVLIVTVLAVYWWRSAVLLGRVARRLVLIEARLNGLASMTYGIDDPVFSYHSSHIPRWISRLTRAQAVQQPIQQRSTATEDTKPARQQP
jgi:hypothetical protein